MGGMICTGLATWWLRFFDRGPLELVWHWAYHAPRAQSPLKTVDTT